jgi:hypothetical protein
VFEGGLAEVDGRIIPGDRIAAIKQYLDDGDAYTFSFDSKGITTHEDAKQILRRCKGRTVLFIVRKDEEVQRKNKSSNKTSQNSIIEHSSGSENACKNFVDDNSCDQNNTARESNNMVSDPSKYIYCNTRKYDEKAIPPSPPTISPTESTHTSSQTDTSSNTIFR